MPATKLVSIGNEKVCRQQNWFPSATSKFAGNKKQFAGNKKKANLPAKITMFPAIIMSIAENKTELSSKFKGVPHNNINLYF